MNSFQCVFPDIRFQKIGKMFCVVLMCFHTLLAGISAQTPIKDSVVSEIRKVIPISQINSSFDDYAGSFRRNGSVVEFWFTRSGGKNQPSKIYNAVVGKMGFSIPQEITSPEINSRDFSRGRIPQDGAPHFAGCNGSIGYFVSNRYHESKNQDNDIYEMKWVNNSWSVHRADELNTKFWDDTPALSPDGKVLYFASKRRTPQEFNRADLFYAVKTASGWSKPRPLDEVNTDSTSQEMPFVGEDGYLYFSSNRSGDYDIWRMKINADYLPENNAKALKLDTMEFPGVNRKGNDELNPMMSPGNEWFVFVSDRIEGTSIGEGNVKNKTKDLDVYAIRIAKPQQDITLRVLLRTKERVRSGEVALDSIAPLQTTAKVRNAVTNEMVIAKTNNAGIVKMRLPISSAKLPGIDRLYNAFIIDADSPSTQFISSSDTVFIPSSAKCDLRHETVVWDTSSYRENACKQEFPIYRVRFFVSGYWCPTTILYKQYAKCASLFESENCMTSPCSDNEVYKYQVVRTNAAPCVDYKEFERRGKEFAVEVDSAVALLRDAMSSAFDKPCVERAIRNGDSIQVEIIGTTDPRILNEACLYTGVNFDELNRFVNGFVQPNPQIIPFIREGQKFRTNGFGGKYGGNQLLSDLRAYHTATMLHNVWLNEIPRYKEIFKTNKLSVRAFGEAVSTENTTLERQRSIRVRITVPSVQEFVRKGATAEPGGVRSLCSDCSTENIRSLVQELKQR
jgi:hypothetical protein